MEVTEKPASKKKYGDQSYLARPGRSERITCPICLYTIRRGHLSTHKKSKHHISIANNINYLMQIKIRDEEEREINMQAKEREAHAFES